MLCYLPINQRCVVVKDIRYSACALLLNEHHKGLDVGSKRQVSKNSVETVKGRIKRRIEQLSTLYKTSKPLEINKLKGRYVFSLTKKTIK